MDKKLLESSEFYNIRYRNFSTIIILPIFLLLVSVAVIIFFLKREVTVKSTGRIVPKRVVDVVQATSENEILGNYLENGKIVKTGDVIIRFKNKELDSELKSLESYKDALDKQKSALETLEKSYKSDRNEFVQRDQFGISSRFETYISMIGNLDAEFNERFKEVERGNKTKEKNRNRLIQAQSDAKKQKGQCEYVKSLIDRDENIKLTNNPFSYVSERFFRKKNCMPVEEAEQMRAEEIEFLVNLEAQLSERLENYRQELTVIEDDEHITKDVIDSKKNILKNEHLMAVRGEIYNVNNEKEKLEAKILETENLKKHNSVKSPTNGILYTQVGDKRPSFFSKGEDIGYIYPMLSDKPKLNVEFWVPTREVGAVRLGRKVRFDISQSTSRPLIAHGKVINVSSVAEETRGGMAFKVIATLNIPAENYKKIKYGGVGQLTVRAGEETWGSYFKKRLWGNGDR